MGNIKGISKLPCRCFLACLKNYNNVHLYLWCDISTLALFFCHLGPENLFVSSFFPLCWKIVCFFPFLENKTKAGNKFVTFISTTGFYWIPLNIHLYKFIKVVLLVPFFHSGNGIEIIWKSGIFQSFWLRVKNGAFKRFLVGICQWHQ